MLDLDDIGAPVGEDRARSRNESELRHFENPNTFHDLRHIHNLQAKSAGRQCKFNMNRALP